MAVIEIQNLSYIYNPGTPSARVALKDFSISIEAGKFVGIIGHTGSGKSTLIQHFNGLLKPANGKVLIDGIDIWEDKKTLKKLRLEVGLVFQYPEYQLFEETVEKDIAFGPLNMGLEGEELNISVEKAAQFAGIDSEMLKKSPFELSGGQKRRAAIAGVLAMHPKILVLDEPAAGLDPVGRRMILEQIKNYHKEQKNTVILVSHSMEDIAKYATEVLVINKGEKLMYAPTNDVFRQSAKLAEIGLALPQITRVFHDLIEKGYPLRPDIYTIADAKNEIVRIVREKNQI
ncbi:MAG: energy-coupling factor transporter ATPase [Oscillospiraceae bacterium]|nr:energy-coupling factor transporter ATPase [Oscillospiraceae bacterium]